jgi:uncharacterized protein
MLLTAFIMGIAGSLHCAGMCSPLAMAITSRHPGALTNRIVYNLGRITTYGLLGAVVGTIGYVLPFGKFQNALSLTLGISLLIMVAFGTTGVQIPFYTKAVVKFTIGIKRVFGRFIRSKSHGALMLLGALNGLLPCGLTFLALSLCVTLSTPLEGFAYMFTFGLGTLPVMLGLVSVFGLIPNRLQWNIKGITTALMVISGLLLIARVFLIHIPEGYEGHANFVDIVICR